MSHGLYISAAGALAQSQRVEVLSNNIANADTTGFKRELAVLEARHTEAIERGLSPAGSRSQNDVGGGVQMKQTLTDYSAGPLKDTGIATDMAIDGPGFFMLERDGEKLLTRGGNFRVNRGRLETQDGAAVLNQGGSEITIDGNQPWRLLPSGVVFQEGTNTPLAIVKPRSMGDMVKRGDNTFASLAEVSPVAEAERHVVSGFLEMSSVRPTIETMEMIEASRAFETNVRMLQNQDQLTGSLLSRLLRVQ